MNVNWSLICIYFLSLSSYASISVIAPFFPSEASKKGVSTSLAGGVFSIFGLVLILMNAVAGKLIPFIGSKVALNVGVIIVGLANVAFGLLDKVDDSDMFIILCFAVRVVEAIGAALLNTTAYMIIIKKSGEHLSRSIAINEACSSIGFTVGPPLGSLFYTIGGYQLPFLVLGTTVLVAVPFSLILIENYKDFSVSDEQSANGQNLSYVKLLSMPKVVIACLTIFAVGNNYGCLASTLELYLESYEIGPHSVGFMFMLTSAACTTFSLIIGQFFSKSDGFRLLTFGLLINSFAFAIIGPSPFFVLKGSSAITAVALFLIGIGNAFALIPSMPTILTLTADDGYSCSVKNSSYVSGLWTTVYSMGHTVGPLFGAALYQHFDSETMFTLIASVNLICAFISFQPLLNYCNKRTEIGGENYSEIDVCDSQLTAGVCDKRQLSNVRVESLSKK